MIAVIHTPIICIEACVSMIQSTATSTITTATIIHIAATSRSSIGTLVQIGIRGMEIRTMTSSFITCTATRRIIPNHVIPGTPTSISFSI